MVKTRSLYLTLSWNGTGAWQTPGHQDRITKANTRYSFASSRV